MLIILEILLEAQVSFHDILAYSAYFFLIWGERETETLYTHTHTYTHTYGERLNLYTYIASLSPYIFVYVYIVSLTLPVCLSLSLSLSLYIYIVSQSIQVFRQIFSMFLYRVTYYWSPPAFVIIL